MRIITKVAAPKTCEGVAVVASLKQFVVKMKTRFTNDRISSGPLLTARLDTNDLLTRRVVRGSADINGRGSGLTRVRWAASFGILNYNQIFNAKTISDWTRAIPGGTPASHALIVMIEGYASARPIDLIAYSNRGYDTSHGTTALIKPFSGTLDRWLSNNLGESDKWQIAQSITSNWSHPASEAISSGVTLAKVFGCIYLTGVVSVIGFRHINNYNLDSSSIQLYSGLASNPGQINFYERDELLSYVAGDQNAEGIVMNGLNSRPNYNFFNNGLIDTSVSRPASDFVDQYLLSLPPFIGSPFSFNDFSDMPNQRVLGQGSAAIESTKLYTGSDNGQTFIDCLGVQNNTTNDNGQTSEEKKEDLPVHQPYTGTQDGDKPISEDKGITECPPCQESIPCPKPPPCPSPVPKGIREETLECKNGTTLIKIGPYVIEDDGTYITLKDCQTGEIITQEEKEKEPCVGVAPCVNIADQGPGKWVVTFEGQPKEIKFIPDGVECPPDSNTTSNAAGSSSGNGTLGGSSSGSGTSTSGNKTGGGFQPVESNIDNSVPSLVLAEPANYSTKYSELVLGKNKISEVIRGWVEGPKREKKRDVRGVAARREYRISLQDNMLVLEKDHGSNIFFTITNLTNRDKIVVAEDSNKVRINGRESYLLEVYRHNFNGQQELLFTTGI